MSKPISVRVIAVLLAIVVAVFAFVLINPHSAAGIVLTPYGVISAACFQILPSSSLVNPSAPPGCAVPAGSAINPVSVPQVNYTSITAFSYNSLPSTIIVNFAVPPTPASPGAGVLFMRAAVALPLGPPPQPGQPSQGTSSLIWALFTYVEGSNLCQPSGSCSYAWTMAAAIVELNQASNQVISEDATPTIAVSPGDVIGSSFTYVGGAWDLSAVDQNIGATTTLNLAIPSTTGNVLSVGGFQFYGASCAAYPSQPVAFSLYPSTQSYQMFAQLGHPIGCGESVTLGQNSVRVNW